MYTWLHLSSALRMHLFIYFNLATAQKPVLGTQSVVKQSVVLTNCVGDAALGDCNGVRLV